MQRREFIGLAGFVTVAWPLTAYAQRPDRVRRVGVLEATTANDPESKLRSKAFEQGLQQLGWTQGQNLQIDYRWGEGDANRLRKNAEELVSLAPDVILTTGTSGTGPALRATRTVPIVFVIVPDPVGSGFVNSLAQPGGNATGFVQFEYALSGKWLELLKQIAPDVTRALVLWDPTLASGIGQFAIIQSVATPAGVDVRPINLADAGEIERVIAEFARAPNGGLIVTISALSVVHRDLIIALAARHKLPAVYPNDLFIRSGGLISYGADTVDQFGRAAGYRDAR